MRAEDLTKTLDLMVLADGTTDADIERACSEAREHHFAALCVRQEHVPLVAELLRGCDVKTCAVIDHPSGSGTTNARALAADRAVAEGADEIDVVMNYSGMLTGDFRGDRRRGRLNVFPPDEDPDTVDPALAARKKSRRVTAGS